MECVIYEVTLGFVTKEICSMIRKLVCLLYYHYVVGCYGGVIWAT